MTLAVLTVAPLGVFYRRGERRAFWGGFVLCGWTYMALSSGPWLVGYVRPQLVTSKLLEWAYPRLIPPARQPSHPRFLREHFVVPAATLQEGLTVDELSRSPVDVWVKEGENPPTLLVEGVRTIPTLLVEGVRTIDSGTTSPTLDVDRDQNALLAQAKAYSRRFILRRGGSRPFAAMWSVPPVETSDFEGVGHSLFGLLCAWLGGMAGRYFFATREATPGGQSQ